jgi:hypothetical protein
VFRLAHTKQVVSFLKFQPSCSWTSKSLFYIKSYNFSYNTFDILLFLKAVLGIEFRPLHLLWMCSNTWGTLPALYSGLFSLYLIFYYHIIVSLEGYIVTFTKVLAIYHSWINPLHHSPLSSFPMPGIVSVGLIFSIYIYVYTVFALYSPSNTLSLYSLPSYWYQFPRKNLFCPLVI